MKSTPISASFMLLAWSFRALTTQPVSPDPLSGYKSWFLLTKEPSAVPMSLWIMCSHPTPGDIARAEQQHGPHTMRYIKVFANQEASRALAGKSPHRFPVGAAIVKEKLLSLESSHPSGVGAMVKREAGFDPKNGDWRFIFLPEGSRTPTSVGSACADCHRSRAHEDFVFGSYSR